MKMKQFKESVDNLSINDLIEYSLKLRQELLQQRFSKANGQLKDTSLPKKTRKQLAYIETMRARKNK